MNAPLRKQPAAAEETARPQQMVSAQGGETFSTVRNLWPYMWPADRPDLKLRVAAAMAV